MGVGNWGAGEHSILVPDAEQLGRSKRRFVVKGGGQECPPNTSIAVAPFRTESMGEISDSLQQCINDGFDVNHGRVEKFDSCVAGVAQE